MKTALRVVLGVIFLASAILKLQSIDSFEVYLYSFGFLKLSTAFIFSRLVISLELLLGVLLIFGIYLRKTITISALMTLFFTAFLVVLAFGDNTDHCHCFGDYLKMSPLASIGKNIVLLVLLGFIYGSSATENKFKKYLFAGFAVLSLAIPMIISPPDTFFIEKYAKKTSYNEQSLNHFLKENNYDNDTKVLCFFSPTCRFCKLAVKKIAVIANKSNRQQDFQFIFWGSEEKIEQFFEDTHTPVFPYSTLNGHDFLEITDGKMPLIVLLKNGKVQHKYGYRSIEEGEILDFLRTNDK